MNTSSREYRRYDRKSLEAIFRPQNTAIVGASEKEGSIGRTLLWNMISNPYGGMMFPINPNRSSVLGIKAYPKISAVPEQVDLAIIATPANTVPEVIEDSIAAGVTGAIIISSGFREIGEKGMKLEQRILNRARWAGLRILGPNCFGVMMPHRNYSASLGRAMVNRGNVGFISQSGAVAAAILDWSFQENVGFSAFISSGNMLDIDWGDLIYFLGDDPYTHSVVVYMESIGDARSFISAAREIALSKPIIVLKSGHTEHASEQGVFHNHEFVTSDAILNAAFRRCGVLPVKSLVDLFAMAEILGKQPRPAGNRLTIVTNSGGPGIIAADALLRGGGKLASLSDKSIQSLNKMFSKAWEYTNPVNILRDADPTRFEKALEIVTSDPNSDGYLVIMSPQAMTDPDKTAEKIKPFAKSTNKPILVSWMGGAEVAKSKALLNQANIPTFPFPDTAVQIFNYMWKYSYNLEGLYETPYLPIDSSEDDASARGKINEIIEKVRSSGRDRLHNFETKQILAVYKIPAIETEIANSEEAAIQHAKKMGFPVAMKPHSSAHLPHPSAKGVCLNLNTEDSVRDTFRAIKNSIENHSGQGTFEGVIVQEMIGSEGYELTLGSLLDAKFGPVILFGAGGKLAEIYHDYALGLPPLNSTLARRMVEQIHLYTALKGEVGGMPIKLHRLEQLLVQFSRLVVEQRWIKAVKLNPLFATADELKVVDAEIIIHIATVKEDELPQLAIRPYPAQYIQRWKLRDGMPVTIRPIRPEDEPLMVKFHETLSDQSVYFRYFHPMSLHQRVSHDRLARICFIDYDREMALVVERKNPKDKDGEIIGVGRLSKLRGINEAEYAIIISDQYQKTGLGTKLLSMLVDIGRQENLDRIVADVLPENRGMLKVSEKVGFTLKHDHEEQIVKAAIKL